MSEIILYMDNTQKSKYLKKMLDDRGLEYDTQIGAEFPLEATPGLKAYGNYYEFFKAKAYLKNCHPVKE